MTKAEIFQRDVHEELSRRKKAENDVIDVIGKVMFQPIFSHLLEYISFLY